MQVRFVSSAPDPSAPLVLPIVAGTAPEALPLLDGTAREIARAAALAAKFEAEAGGIVDVIVPVAGGTRRLVLLGVGGADAKSLEKAGAALVGRFQTSGEAQLVVDLGVAKLEGPAEAAARLALGASLRAWRHDVYRTKLGPKQRPSLEELLFVGAGGDAEARWAPLRALVEGASFARTLVAEPANMIYPESFAERCLDLRDLGVDVDVLDEDAMRAAGMGALLGVAQGSARPARLLVLRWDGTGGAKEPIALVGKGVTFDTGGISIKPAAGMEDMKWDMGGAAAVAGAMRVLAARKAKAHVIGVCGLVENMPDGKAQRPGDVVTTMSGQTVEVINTDAEGRLVLCDALTWVQRHYRPKTIVDLATLTGAMIITLGHEHGGLFANDDDLAEQLLAAGKASGETLWRLPMGDTYDKMIESPIADMKNVGPREAGSITAAQFLRRYIDDGVRWAHLDIAGMVWASKPGTLHDKGATGYGVRLLDQFVADYHEG